MSSLVELWFGVEIQSLTREEKPAWKLESSGVLCGLFDFYVKI